MLSARVALFKQRASQTWSVRGVSGNSAQLGANGRLRGIGRGGRRLCGERPARTGGAVPGAGDRPRMETGRQGECYILDPEYTVSGALLLCDRLPGSRGRGCFTKACDSAPLTGGLRSSTRQKAAPQHEALQPRIADVTLSCVGPAVEPPHASIDGPIRGASLPFFRIETARARSPTAAANPL